MVKKKNEKESKEKKKIERRKWKMENGKWKGRRNQMGKACLLFGPPLHNRIYTFTSISVVI